MINDFTLYKRVSTKEELKESLDRHKSVLNKTVIDYLNQLIELEFSAAKDNIDISDRKILHDLELYKKIAAYNIYNRTLSLLKEQEELKIFDNQAAILGIMAYKNIGNNSIRIFDYQYNKETIKLFQIVEDKKIKDEQLKLVKEQLGQLYDIKNPYEDYKNFYGGSFARWEIEHNLEVDKYEKMLESLDNKKEITDYDQEKIEVTKKYHDLLFEEYGLTDQDFDSYRDLSIKNINKKVLVKELPGLRIENNIEYV